MLWCFLVALKFSGTVVDYSGVAFPFKSKCQRPISLRAYNLQLLLRGVSFSRVSICQLAQKLQIWGFLHDKAGSKHLREREPGVCSPLWSLEQGSEFNWIAIYSFEIKSPGSFLFLLSFFISCLIPAKTRSTWVGLNELLSFFCFVSPWFYWYLPEKWPFSFDSQRSFFQDFYSLKTCRYCFLFNGRITLHVV